MLYIRVRVVCYICKMISFYSRLHTFDVLSNTLYCHCPLMYIRIIIYLMMSLLGIKMYNGVINLK